MENKAEFSEKSLQVELPVNFLDCVQSLSADALLVLIAYFQLLSEQEQPGELALLFDFKTSLPIQLQQDEVRLQRVLEELHRAGLLLSWQDPNNPQKTYLIPGTPAGVDIYCKLNGNPDLVCSYQLAKAMPAPDRPNIFKLYEDNFGALTPMMAETLKADAQIYPADWIEDAMQEAVEYNARNWKYVQAILRNWQAKGRKRTNEEGKRDLDQFRKLYLEQKRDHTGG